MPSLDLRERLGSKGTERLVRKRVDRANVDLAKDVGVCAIGVLFPIKKIGIPQDRQLRLFDADDAAELVQPLLFEVVLETLEVWTCGRIVKAWTGLWS